MLRTLPHLVFAGISLELVRESREPKQPGKTPLNLPPKSLKSVRSHVNSRCFFSRYFFWFFGHNSEPHLAFWTKIGGNLPLSLPELSIPIRDLFESNKPLFFNPEIFRKNEKICLITFFIFRFVFLQ